MKWFAMVSLALAFVVKFGWRSSIDLAYRANVSTHRTIPLGSVLFWALLAIGAASLLFVIRKKLGW